LTRFILNETTIETGQPAGMVLLDFIRYHQRLMGTKIGCREGDCGACTVLVGDLIDGKLRYRTMTSCLVPLGNAAGKHIVTVEGINMESTLNPIQQAMVDEGATQCGFCTPGFVMSLAGFCLDSQQPTQFAARASIDGNICRCTGYKSIERAADRIYAVMSERDEEEACGYVTRKKILPSYFNDIKEKLGAIKSSQLNSAIPSKQKTWVGGGTDLYVQKPEELTEVEPALILDNPSLKGIKKENNHCVLGPSTTVTDLLQSTLVNEAFPSFRKFAKLISSTPIRNMATVGGNFINASPIGDLTIFFLALDAKLVVARQDKGTRNISLKELYKGYKQLDMAKDEYLEQVLFEWPAKNQIFHFEKVSKRSHLDIASVNTAISIHTNDNKMEKVRISAGGVGPVPMILEKTSEFLQGKTVSKNIVQQAVEIMNGEISPISDARGSKEYKAFLLGQLIRSHFITLYPDIMEKYTEDRE
jgi:xanthine dehydrogenase small subunit